MSIFGGSVQQKRMAFFSEIRLRRVKYGFAMWNSYAVKYLLRKCEEANFISHCDEGAIFHNSRSELFHIRHRRIFHWKESCISVLWPHEKSTCESKCFFQWNSFLRNEWNAPSERESLAGEPEIRLWRVGERILFHIDRREIFHNSRSELFHIRRSRIFHWIWLHFCTMTTSKPP